MPPSSRAVCALVSGGLDSAALLHRLLAAGRRVAPLYLRCGFGWEPAELSWLRRVLRALRCPRLAPLRIVELPLRSVYGPHWSLTGRGVPGAATGDAAVYLPGRNVLLVAHAAVACAPRRISAIALGLLKGNPFGDASPQCLRLMSRCLTLALGRPIRVLVPLRRFTKAQLIRRAASVPLALTFSCLRPVGRRHCGRCNKCAERQKAFLRAQIADPTRYASRKKGTGSALSNSRGSRAQSVRHVSRCETTGRKVSDTCCGRPGSFSTEQTGSISSGGHRWKK